MSSDKRWELIKQAEANAVLHKEALGLQDIKDYWGGLSEDTRNTAIGGGLGAAIGGLGGALIPGRRDEEGRRGSRASRILAGLGLGGMFGAGAGFLGGGQARTAMGMPSESYEGTAPALVAPDEQGRSGFDPEFRSDHSAANPHPSANNPDSEWYYRSIEDGGGGNESVMPSQDFIEGQKRDEEREQASQEKNSSDARAFGAYMAKSAIFGFGKKKVDPVAKAKKKKAEEEDAKKKNDRYGNVNVTVKQSGAASSRKKKGKKKKPGNKRQVLIGPEGEATVRAKKKEKKAQFTPAPQGGRGKMLSRGMARKLNNPNKSVSGKRVTKRQNRQNTQRQFDPDFRSEHSPPNPHPAGVNKEAQGFSFPDSTPADVRNMTGGQTGAIAGGATGIGALGGGVIGVIINALRKKSLGRGALTGAMTGAGAGLGMVPGLGAVAGLSNPRNQPGHGLNVLPTTMGNAKYFMGAGAAGGAGAGGFGGYQLAQLMQGKEDEDKKEDQQPEDEKKASSVHSVVAQGTARFFNKLGQQPTSAITATSQGKNHPANQGNDPQGRSSFDPDYNPNASYPGVVVGGKRVSIPGIGKSLKEMATSVPQSIGKAIGRGPVQGIKDVLGVRGQPMRKRTYNPETRSFLDGQN